MLPGPADGAVSLADVLRDSLAAVTGEPTRLGLPRVDRAVVVLVDGLGAESLRARAGHARTLAGAMRTKADVIATGVPTTTAAAITTLTTGARPGEHGIVGYDVLDRASDTVRNQLRGLNEVDELAWQPVPTAFERANAAGLGSVTIATERYRTSGFTRVALRGAEYRSGRTPADRAAVLLDLLADRSWRGIVYLYVAELDMAGHQHGWQSGEWTLALETADAAIASALRGLDQRTGLLVAADHGMLDVAETGTIVIPPALLAGVRHVAGEHRMLHLHVAPDADPGALAARWRDAEGERAWIVTREEAIAAGWFGPVAPAVLPRIGDVLVAPRKAVSYWTEAELLARKGPMIGQHGSWTPAEMRVPLLRFGAFA